MRNPESFNSESNAEAFRTEYQARGHEAKKDAALAAKRQEQWDKQEAIRRKNIEQRRAEIARREADIARREKEYAEYLERINGEVSPAEVVANQKKNPAFKESIKGKVVTAAAIVLGVSIIGGAAIAKAKGGGNISGGPNTTMPDHKAFENTITMNTEDEAPAAETAEEVSGIVDGYDKDGMWLSEGKTGQYAFADFKRVVELHSGDVKGAIKDVSREQVESMSDAISGMSAVRPAGYENLSMAQVNEKIESLPSGEYDNLKKEYDSIIDRAEVSEVTLNGKYDNAYMGVKNGDKVVGSKYARENNLAVNHQSMQLVKCTTNEKGSKAYQLTWKDANGKVIDSLLVKEACTQVVEKQGSNPTRFAGIPEVSEQTIQGGGAITNIITGGGPTGTPNIIIGGGPSPTPTPTPGPENPTPTPTPEPTPTPTPTPGPEQKHDPKDEEKEKKNAGDDVTKLPLDEKTTPKTTEEEDRKNFDEIEKQKAQDQAAKEAAEKAAKEQAEKEKKAQEEAAKRRAEEEAARKAAEEADAQRKAQEEAARKAADEAKKKAEEEAAEQQRKNAEEVKKKQQEEEARRKAQEEAKKKAEENKKEAEKHADDTQKERADLFNSGDF